MADRSVTVRLKVADEFSSPINAYTQKMNQADQATQRAAQGANRAGQGFAQMGTMLKGAIAGVGIMGVATLAEGLYSAGMNAQRAGTLFASFGDQVGSTSALLERLRGVTRGVVDDTTLMSAASTQLSMGLAKNADDVARLTNIGVTFAQAMGTDIGASMENLNMILANQSYLRLDTLGISSSQVRDLAAQYRAAGMDTSEAFNAAFLDVAEQKLPQMSAVADAATTEIQKFQTTVDNWWTDFGTRFATGVNGMLGLIGLLGDAIAGLPGGNGASYIAGGGTVTTSFGETIVIPNMEVSGDMIIASDAQSGALDAQTAAEVAAYRAAQAGRSATNIRDLLGGRGSAAAEFEAILRQQAGRALPDGYRSWGQVQAGQDAYRDMGAAGMVNFGLPQQSAAQRYAGAANYRDYLTGTASQFAGMTGTTLRNGQIGTDARFFSEEDATRARSQLATIQDMVDTAERWNAMTGRDMVSEQDLTAMRGMADEARQWADQVERGSASMASLSDLFGQTGGGQFNEVNQAVLNQMRAGGASSDQLAAAEQQMGLRSGTMTGMSVQFDNQISAELADIYEQLGSEAYFVAQQAYLEGARNLVTENPAFSGTVPWDMWLRDAGINRQEGGQSFTAQPGDTVGALARAAGMSVEDFAAQYGIENPNMIVAGRSYSGGSGYSWDSSMIGNAGDVGAETDRQAQAAADSYQYHLETGFGAAVDTFTSLLNNAAATVVQVPIEFVIQNGGFLNTLFAGAVAQAVAGNGGTVPGSSGNTGRSATGSGTRGTNSSSGYTARGGYNPP
jgi:hypothetical protein